MLLACGNTWAAAYQKSLYFKPTQQDMHDSHMAAVYKLTGNARLALFAQEYPQIAEIKQTTATKWSDAAVHIALIALRTADA